MTQLFNVISLFLTAASAVRALPQNRTSITGITNSEPSVAYVDNGITFRFDEEASNKTLTNASFTVSSFNITVGQDPENINYIGAVHQSYDTNPGRRLNFTTGRNATAEVGEFWDKVHRSGWCMSTFGEEGNIFAEKKFDFAFIGKLSLSIRKGEEDIEWVSRTDMGFALETKEGEDSWRFGGKECERWPHLNDNTQIDYPGINAKDGWQLTITISEGH